MHVHMYLTALLKQRVTSELIYNNDMQAEWKNPFFRPADVDPVQHMENCMDHLSYLSACCRKSGLYNRPSTTTQKDKCDLNLWGKIVDLPEFKCISAAEARSCGELKCSSSISDLPAMETTLRESRSHYFSPMDSSSDLTDYNHNVTLSRKRLLLPPVTSEQDTKQKGVVSAKTSAADCEDDFEPQSSVQCNQPTNKKQAAGQGRAKKPTAEGVKSQSSRGQVAGRGKKKQTRDESKRSRNPRKAKESANNQMKLQFFGSSTTGQSEYDDALAGDIYSYGSSSSPEPKVTTSFSYSRQKDKRTAHADSGSVPPLTQRILNYIPHEPSQSHMGAKYASSFSATTAAHPFESSSQRSSRLFDDMLEQQAKIEPRECISQSTSVAETSRRLRHAVRGTTDTETESIIRYFFTQPPMRRMRMCFTDVFSVFFSGFFPSVAKYQTTVLGNG